VPRARKEPQWSRVLRSDGLNHSKLLCAFVCSSTNLVTGKTLRPLLFLGFRAGAFHHPAGDFLSDNTRHYKYTSYPYWIYQARAGRVTVVENLGRGRWRNAPKPP
jgi:hypothetical protein